MNLIFFFVVLTLCGVVFAKVEPLIVMPVVAPLAMFKNTKNPFVYVVGVVGWLWQIYVVLAWCGSRSFYANFHVSTLGRAQMDILRNWILWLPCTHSVHALI